MEESGQGVDNMKMKSGKSALTRDYGPQFSLSNETRSKQACRDIKDKINRLHRMKKTDLVAKIVQLEKQLLVYSTNGFLSVVDAQKMAEKKSGEENHKLTTKIEQLEERNELLMSRISTIDQMLRERNRKSPQSRPAEEGSNKSSSSSLSTVINVSSQASSSDHSSKSLSLNRSIPEMMESYSVVRVSNIVEPDSNPFHEYSEIDDKDVEEEKKKSKASPNRIGIFKKSLNLISEALSRQHSQKESKKESEKPQNTNPFFESEDDEIDDREKRDEDIPVPDFNSNVLQTLLKESCNEMKDTRTLVKQLSSELLNNPSGLRMSVKNTKEQNQTNRGIFFLLRNRQEISSSLKVLQIKINHLLTHQVKLQK